MFHVHGILNVNNFEGILKIVECTITAVFLYVLLGKTHGFDKQNVETYFKVSKMSCKNCSLYNEWVKTGLSDYIFIFQTERNSYQKCSNQITFIYHKLLLHLTVLKLTIQNNFADSRKKKRKYLDKIPLFSNNTYIVSFFILFL